MSNKQKKRFNESDFFNTINIIVGIFSATLSLASKVFDNPSLLYIVIELWLGVIIYYLNRLYQSASSGKGNSTPPPARPGQKKPIQPPISKNLWERIKDWGREPKRAISLIGMVVTTIFAVLVIVYGIWNARNLGKVERFNPDQFGILISGFRNGSSGFLLRPEDAEISKTLYEDLKRMADKPELAGKIQVQHGGTVITDRQQAIDVGKEYGAKLVVWGYFPLKQPQVVRPSFELLQSEDSNEIDQGMFEVAVLGDDVADMNLALSSRVKSVSSFLVGLSYLGPSTNNNYALAIKYLNQAIIEANTELHKGERNAEDLESNLSEYYAVLGRAYAADGKADESLSSYLNAIDVRSDNERALVGLGNWYYSKNELDRAEEYFQKAGDNYSGLYGLGIVAYKQGDYSVAIDKLKQALNSSQKSGKSECSVTLIKIRYMLAHALLQTPQKIEAQSQFSHVCSCTYPETLKDIHDNACQNINFVDSTPVPFTATSVPTIKPNTLTPCTVTPMLTPSITATITRYVVLATRTPDNESGHEPATIVPPTQVVPVPTIEPATIQPPTIQPPTLVPPPTDTPTHKKTKKP